MSSDTMTDAPHGRPRGVPRRARERGLARAARRQRPRGAARVGRATPMHSRTGCRSSRAGFLDGERSDEQVAATRERSGYRRTTGIYDASAPMPDAPVATIASWIGELTVPGGRGIPSCAISAVTVAPTHRRRGIARAMLEGELGVRGRCRRPHRDAHGERVAALRPLRLRARGGRARRGTSTSSARRGSVRGPAGRVDFIPRERLRELVAPAARAGPADGGGRDRRPRRALGQLRRHPARREGSRQQPGDPVRRRGGRGARARAVLGARERRRTSPSRP